MPCPTYAPTAASTPYLVNDHQASRNDRLPNNRHYTKEAAEEEVVPASEYRALQAQVKELQRLLGKKTMESEILKEALEIAGGPKKRMLRSISLPRGILE